MKHTILMGLIVLCLAATAQTFAQITITSADVAAQLALNATVQNRSDTSAHALNIGSPGATSWNFSALKNYGVTALQSVQLATSPYVAAFPAATHTLRSSIVYAGIDATIYLYLAVGASGLQNFGTKGAVPVPGLTLLLEDLNAPADLVYALPSTFNTTWTSKFTETLTLKANGVDFVPATVTVHNASYKVDAYGLMTMPGGTAHDALRIRKVDSTSSGVHLTFIFLAKNGASVQASAANGDAPNSGTIGVNSISWSQPFNTAVTPPAGRPATFLLAQNYPNPFNPSTLVTFELPERTTASLRVFNLLGEQVATLVDGPLEAGEHQVRFDGARLASGVYLYRLQAGSMIQTRKMILVR